MPVMSCAEALVALLVRDGVEVVFGLPGVQIMDAIDAIYRDGAIRWISTRHEQTAAYMAYGYARTTGKIGVAMVLAAAIVGLVSGGDFVTGQTLIIDGGLSLG